VIVEGANYLMAVGRFKSFRAPQVIADLQSAAPRWQSLFDLSAKILDDPYSAGLTPDRFMKMVSPFITWTIAAIKNS
jgi:hypothetical protein